MASAEITNAAVQNFAVVVKNVCKSYSHQDAVLSSLSINVEAGSIYGLMGPSGCGKTTLLSCIVGLMRWNSGSISLFGKSVHSMNRNHIGYMSQDTSLYNAISLKETIEYYGRLYALPAHKIDEKWKYITNFLNLPDAFLLLKDCSGGMKRRVSLAVAIFHNPKLLVLDEPTVGLDPLLRETIWNHLYRLAKMGTTVLLSTHYTEELRNADKIGIIKGGKILVEERPTVLLEGYNCRLLEDCILQLFRKDEDEQISLNLVRSECSISRQENGGQPPFARTIEVGQKQIEPGVRDLSMEYNAGCEDIACCNPSPNFFGRLHAFFVVTWLQLLRHPVFLSCIIILPASQALLTLLVVGETPKNIKYGVVNLESPLNYDCLESALNSSNSDYWNTSYISCLLIRHLSKSRTLKLTSIMSERLAKSEVKAGNLWGYLTFPTNYSNSLLDLVTTKQFSDNETLKGSRVFVTMDMSHVVISKMVIRDIFLEFFDFARKIAESRHINPLELQLPLHFREPVYGNNDFTFTGDVIPCVLCFTVAEISILLTGLMYIAEIQQGTLTRAHLAGLQFQEVLICHLITQGSLVLAQGTIFSAVIHIIWGLRLEGQVWLYGFLVLLSGFVGGTLGLLIGIVMENAADALVTGIWLAIYLVSYAGFMEPIEALKPWTKHLAYGLPGASAVEPMRSVMYRGFGILHKTVWTGILKLTGWCMLLSALSIVIFNIKRKHW